MKHNKIEMNDGTNWNIEYTDEIDDGFPAVYRIRIFHWFLTLIVMQVAIYAGRCSFSAGNMLLFYSILDIVFYQLGKSLMPFYYYVVYVFYLYFFFFLFNTSFESQ